MAIIELDKKRLVVCRISSSIDNFREKLLNRFGFTEWHWWKNRHDKVIFFGMYHIGDYLRLLWHRGPNTIFWCGGDIQTITLMKAIVLSRIKTRHICENEVEQYILRLKVGINAEIHPMIFDDPKQFAISFLPSNTPAVFICAHPGKEFQYGINMIEEIALELTEFTFHVYGISRKNTKNVVYHGKVSNEQFNKEIKNYQAGLRCNEPIDGFSEVLAKSILLGQYPIMTKLVLSRHFQTKTGTYGEEQFVARVAYPFVDVAENKEELIALLNGLKNKKQPNYRGREYWLEKFNRNPFV